MTVSSRYVVFQYAPDPASGERINFGVAAQDDFGFYARFLRSWRRVRSFAGVDISFLQEFAQTVETSSARSLLDDPVELARPFMDEAPTSWINVIRVTTPRASTKPADDLINDVARRFLRAAPRQTRGKDRRWVRAVARETLVGALDSAGLANALELVHPGKVEGSIEEHDFDLTINNGVLSLAALTLSFQKQSATALQREYASAAWALEDVHKLSADLPLAVVMLPPARGTSKTFEQARRVFEALDARPVVENELTDWAGEVADSLIESRFTPRR
jgi:hypothetical protein